MNVGDKVSCIPDFLLGNETSPLRQKVSPQTGTVVYIHPQGRYYTVEFEMGDGKVKESYSL